MTKPLDRLDPLELITIKDLAALAKRHPNTIRADVKAGRLRHVRLGHSIRIPRVEAERYLTSGSNGQP